MSVDITPLLPALFWSGVVVMVIWIVVMLPDALAAFREAAGTVAPMPGEDEPAARGHAH